MNTPDFVDDIKVQGTYFAVIIRSPIAHGRLKAVQCPDMPNSYTLITAADIPGVNQLADFPVPVLADDTLSYIGEPVGILTGFDMRELENYAAQCEVVCEELSPVFSSGEIPPSRILGERRVSLGNTAEREEPDHTISGIYKTGIQEHWYAEPHGAVAIPAQDRLVYDKRPEENPLDKMLIHTATVWPFHVKRSVCQVLGIPSAGLVVEPSLIGIHLDGKIWYPSLVACHAALAAHLIRRPVKLALTREEDFRYSPKRNAAVISITSAIGLQKKTLETNITVRADLGSNGVFTDEILDHTCLGSLGAYSWPRLTMEGRAFSTNLPPQGPLSGFGLAQGFFAIERHVSRIADSLQQDPAEWRKNHALQDRLGIGAPLDAPPIAELIDSAAAMCDYYRKWASYELLRQKRRGKAWRVQDESPRGIGIAVAYQGNGFLYQWNKNEPYAIELTLNKNSLEIRTGLVFSNISRDSCVERWRNIAAEILLLDEQHISVSTGNTDTAPDSGPASCSQNVVTITSLVEEACNELKERRANPAESFPLHTRRAYRPVLRSAWGDDSGKQVDERALSNLSWAAAVVEVSIDQVSYLPNIRGVWLGVEAGRVFSKEQACLSLKTSTIHALGWAAYEELAYKSGKIPDSRMFGYHIPSIAELPRIDIDFMKRGTPHCKGIGELPFNCVPAAYVQAVSQAMDHPFEKIPLTPPDLWNVEQARLQSSSDFRNRVLTDTKAINV